MAFFPQKQLVPEVRTRIPDDELPPAVVISERVIKTCRRCGDPILAGKKCPCRAK